MQNNPPSKDLAWVNTVKAVCMICVYWAHSEAYCPIASRFSIMPYIAPFYVNAFFVVSGYLFFRSMDQKNGGNDFYRKFQNVIFKLVIPTIIFSSLIFVPKCLFHSSGISLRHYVCQVGGGIAYWFTSALAVTQLVMILLCVLLKKRHGIIFILSCLLLFAAIWLQKLFVSPFPWYWESGLAGCFLFSCGGAFYQYESARWHKYAWIVALAIIASVGCIGAWSPEWVMMSCRFNFSGFLVMAATTLLLFAAAKKLPRVRALDFIGRNSILFYFFSGTLPALCGNVWRRLLPGRSSYILIFAAMAIELLSAACLTFGITRVAPFLLDLRRVRTRKEEK